MESLLHADRFARKLVSMHTLFTQYSPFSLLFHAIVTHMYSSLHQLLVNTNETFERQTLGRLKQFVFLLSDQGDQMGRCWWLDRPGRLTAWHEKVSSSRYKHVQVCCVITQVSVCVCV